MKKIFKIILTFIKVRWIDRWDNIKKLEKYQEKNIRKQLKFFKEKSPYFKNEKFKENMLMNKEFMMENFDELNTVGIKKDVALELAMKSEKSRNFKIKYKSISVGLSSGTSGHRGIFITTDDEQAIWAGTILAKMLPKGFKKHRIAFFLRANNELYNTINSYFIKFRYYDIFIEIEKYIENLNQYQPTILVAPASILTELGKYREQKILKINPIKIISVAEILEDGDRNYLKKCFSLEIIHQIYQATEGFLAYTCECGNFHLNEDIIKFEKDYIDEKRFYPIITDFKRTSQPFIRYYLNDILVEDNRPCDCGSVLQRIEKIEGRADDIFEFYNKSGNKIKIFPDFIRRCLLFVDNIREYQVFQVDFITIEIAVLNIKEEQKIEVKKEFDKLFKSYKIENVNINFVEYKINNNVKLKRIVRIKK